MPEVVDPRLAVTMASSPAQSYSQSPEGGFHALERDGCAAAGEEECLDRRGWVETIASITIFAQGAEGGSV